MLAKSIQLRDSFWTVAIPETTDSSALSAAALLLRKHTKSAVQDDATQTHHDVRDESLQTDQPLFVEYGNDAPVPIARIDKASSAAASSNINTQHEMTSTGDLATSADEPIDRAREMLREDEVDDDQTSVSIKVKMQWPMPDADQNAVHRESLLKQYYEKQIDQLRTRVCIISFV